MPPETPSISTLIITNPDWFWSEEKFRQCLESVSWTDEILIATPTKPDHLIDIAQEYQAKVYIQSGKDFASWRTGIAQKAKSDWLFYIDTDEMIPEDLKKEIQRDIASDHPKAAYAIPRSNVILGKAMRHGGWWPDYVVRLIQADKFQGYQGELHEQPKIKGQVGHLHHYLLHLKHDNLEEMVEKTIHWSEIEGQLLLDADHPVMNPRRFLRPMISEIFTRLIKKKGFIDGPEGVIDAIYQGYSRFISYAKLWESQVSAE
jgi:hypothetical protein